MDTNPETFEDDERLQPLQNLCNAVFEWGCLPQEDYSASIAAIYAAQRKAQRAARKVLMDCLDMDPNDRNVRFVLDD